MFTLVVILLLSTLFVSNKLYLIHIQIKLNKYLKIISLVKKTLLYLHFKILRNFQIGAVSGFLFPPTLERINLEIKQQNIIKLSPKKTLIKEMGSCIYFCWRINNLEKLNEK